MWAAVNSDEVEPFAIAQEIRDVYLPEAVAIDPGCRLIAGTTVALTKPQPVAAVSASEQSAFQKWGHREPSLSLECETSDSTEDGSLCFRRRRAAGGHTRSGHCATFSSRASLDFLGTRIVYFSRAYILLAD